LDEQLPFDTKAADLSWEEQDKGVEILRLKRVRGGGPKN
jgi:hypothetical protein